MALGAYLGTRDISSNRDSIPHRTCILGVREPDSKIKQKRLESECPKDKLGKVGGKEHCNFNRMVKEGLNEKVMFEQRPEKKQRNNPCRHLGNEQSAGNRRANEETLKHEQEQLDGQNGYSGVSTRERRQRGNWASHSKDFDFYSESDQKSLGNFN